MIGFFCFIVGALLGGGPGWTIGAEHCHEGMCRRCEYDRRLEHWRRTGATPASARREGE